jgi:hypothetical protein
MMPTGTFTSLQAWRLRPSKDIDVTSWPIAAVAP